MALVENEVMCLLSGGTGGRSCKIIRSIAAGQVPHHPARSDVLVVKKHGAFSRYLAHHAITRSRHQETSYRLIGRYEEQARFIDSGLT